MLKIQAIRKDALSEGSSSRHYQAPRIQGEDVQVVSHASIQG